MQWHQILCPVDFSEDSRLALETAIQLAKENQGTIVLAHVFQGAGRSAPDGGVTANLVNQVASEVGDELGQWRKNVEAAGVTASAAQVHGEAWEEIVRLASDRKVDLIVMSTHGLTGLAHVLIGSTAERVVRQAPCPVLVIRGKQRT